MVRLRRVFRGGMTVSFVWALMFGVVTFALSIRMAGWVTAFAIALVTCVLGQRTPRARSEQLPPPPARPPSRARAAAGVVVFAGVAVADVVFGADRARQFGPASLLVPGIALGALATARLAIGSCEPSTPRRVAVVAVWVAFCALGIALAFGVPSTHDEALGGFIVGFAIGSLELLWRPVRRELKWLWVRAKPPLKFLLGDWENDAG